MRKPIFENDEEARQFAFAIRGGKDTYCDEIRDMIVDRIRDAGYIRRSPVEESEEMYSRYIIPHPTDKCFEDELIIKQHDAIQYLKKQLEEKC